MKNLFFSLALLGGTVTSYAVDPRMGEININLAQTRETMSKNLVLLAKENPEALQDMASNTKAMEERADEFKKGANQLKKETNRRNTVLGCTLCCAATVLCCRCPCRRR